MKNKIKMLLMFFLISFIYFLYFAVEWTFFNYNSPTFEEILFTLFSNVEKTESSLVLDFIRSTVTPASFFGIITTAIIWNLKKSVGKSNIKVNIHFFRIQKTFNFNKKLIKIMFNICTSLFLTFILFITSNKVGLFDFIKYNSLNSYLIKNEYVNPQKVKLTFPKNKKNLIYIYVESLENTFFSEEYGGAESQNLMKSLVKLTEENTQFSNSEKFGGAYNMIGMHYTSASMVAQTSGLPVKGLAASKKVNLTNLSSYMKNAYSIGQILEKENYNNMLMIGSEKEFGNRGIYFKTHGNYKIFDYNTAIKTGKISKDYYEFWGFEDGKLFEYAKEEILKLDKENKPFNFTLLTSDTHHVDGYLEKGCSEQFDDQLSNVISCSTGQISSFIEWIKMQPFYKNTTIVIVGDHLHMNNQYFDNIDSDYTRTIYNLFINSSITNVDKERLINREFTVLDMFPTTLASMGVQIEGDRLGLGTNLYSKKKTIIERYGYNKVYDEFKKKSKFYNNNFIDE